jgi:site-specific DNA recombinase
MKRVIELVRVSTDAQAGGDRASIPAQRTINRRTCQQFGLQIVRSFEISDVSGARVMFAPEVLEMLELMKASEIHGVVTREFSRLIRPEQYSDYALLDVFINTNTLLYLPEGPIDFTSKTGRLFGTIRAAFAGLERQEILERVWTAKEEKRKRGELAQSEVVLPFGVGYKAGKFFYKPEAEKIREAFRQFLAGNQNYSAHARTVGVTPRGMHLILRNAIWTGWRVIDKKRDLSSAGRYSGVNGRQADRRKVARHPDEIIRTRVIQNPLISEAQFAAVQRIMDRKQARHWRSQNRQARFVYNGFLTCSACGEIIHTALARRYYYACKGRRLKHTCATVYMAREKLETILDQLFGRRIVDPAFLERCVQAFEDRHTATSSNGQVLRLTETICTLRKRRERVIETYFDGVIERSERDSLIQLIDADIHRAHDQLMQQELSHKPIDTRTLVDYFAPLGEWEYWSRENKRLFLSTLVPDIRVANYEIQSLGLPATLFSNEVTPGGKDSSQRRA